MICRNCGNELAPGANVCPNCGTPVATQAQEQTTAQAPEQTTAQAQPTYYPTTNAPTPGKVQGIIALVAGILSVLLSCCIPYVSLPLAVVGIILGILGNKQAKAAGEKNTLAFVGIIISAVAIAISVIMLILVIVGISFGNSISSGYNDYYYY